MERASYCCRLLRACEVEGPSSPNLHSSCLVASVLTLLTVLDHLNLALHRREHHLGYQPEVKAGIARVSGWVRQTLNLCWDEGGVTVQ